MTRTFLLRGMFAGLIAGLLVFALARMVGEPQVERAIAFESALDAAHGEAPEPEVVSRRIQKSAGLLTGVVVYGSAVGGIFGLVFAFCVGRVQLGPRPLAAWLALAAFLTIALVPDLKYPANPPAVGNPETIGIRTAAYFLLIAFSIAAAVLAVQACRGLSARLGAWNAALVAIAIYVVIMAVIFHFLPAIDEVPAGFPVDLMWRFRVAALGMQAVLWASVGLLFGWLTERTQPARLEA